LLALRHVHGGAGGDSLEEGEVVVIDLLREREVSLELFLQARCPGVRVSFLVVVSPALFVDERILYFLPALVRPGSQRFIDGDRPDHGEPFRWGEENGSTQAGTFRRRDVPCLVPGLSFGRRRRS